MTAASYTAPTEPVARLLGKLDGIRRSGAGWTARCPAHRDRQASLSVTAGDDGRALVYCHAGCPVEAVTGAAGIGTADLFEPRDVSVTRTTSRRREVSSNGPPTLYAIRGADGEPVAVHVRTDGPEGKRIAWRLPDGTAGLGGIATADLPLFGSEQLAKWDTSRPVIVAEGEKAALALLGAGFRALGTVTGAASAPSVAVLQSLRGHHVALWPDNDDAGRKHMHKVAERLAGIAGSLRVVTWPDAPPHGDAADLLTAGSPADVDSLLSIAVPLTSLGPVLVPLPPPASAYPEPEDRGSATLSELGAVEYVEDLIRPGRIVVVAAEEGTGKSYAITGELAIRVATAGGSFAGTWPILRQGPVLVLSEMHADDDYTREAAILDALELEREALAGRYYRLPLASAAGDSPALQVPEWREWITGWLRERGALLVVFDTATGAAQVDPWGGDIQAVYRGLRMMIEQYAELAIVLIVHLKKPQGRGERRISDVLGEWGRWCDVLLLLEREGETRVKLSARKRVRHERRIVATKAAGLLIEPQDMGEGSGPKVPLEQVIEAVRAAPGLSIKALAERLGVARGTARAYLDKVPAIVLIPGKHGALTCHLSDGVNEGTDMLPTPNTGTDVSPVNPSIDRGVTDMSRPLVSEESDTDLLDQLRLLGEDGPA